MSTIRIEIEVEDAEQACNATDPAWVARRILNKLDQAAVVCDRHMIWRPFRYGGNANVAQVKKVEWL